MSDLHEGHSHAQAGIATIPMDAGLRRYMLGVYNKVGLGLLLASVIAYATATVPELRDLLFKTTATASGAPRIGLTFLGSMAVFGPLFLLLGAGVLLARPTPLRTGVLYWSVVALLGVSLGVLFLTFTGGSIATTLAITAFAFGGLSLVGYTTKRDLSGLGGFMTMGLIGLVAALVVNLVLRSPAVGYVSGLGGILIFAGLIAYDTQRLKLAYRQYGGENGSMAVATDLAALGLFINFINLFQFLLMMVSGERR